MIVPFLDGFMIFSRIPVTWILILFNVFLFSQNYELSNDCHSQLKLWYEDQDFLYTQGQIYKQFTVKRDIARVQDVTMIGRLAFRDESFLEQAPDSQWHGDPIAIERWQKDIKDFLVVRAYYPPFLLGVSESRQDLFSFVSYQFYHEGFLHLLGNLLLVLLVGGYIESRYTGLTVFSTYILGGWIAAMLFVSVNGISGAPLVGASGSLCALLGFLLISEWREKTRLFYLILPVKPYYGFVFVPTLYWVLWLCMVEDVVGLISQPAVYSSGVAHAVHIFGFLCGMAIAYFYKFFGRARDERNLSYSLS